MAIKVNIFGNELTCEQPEEALLIAGAASTWKPDNLPKFDTLSARPIKIQLNGVEIICETPTDAAATLAAAGIVRLPHLNSKEARTQGSGPTKAWNAAREYALCHGISADEARRVLARQKKELKARAILNDSESKPKSSY